MGYIFYQFVIVFLLLLSMVSCNTAEDYFPKDHLADPSHAIEGVPDVSQETSYPDSPDEYDGVKIICMAALDEISCRSLNAICRPAFEELDNGAEHFYACVPRTDTETVPNPGSNIPPVLPPNPDSDPAPSEDPAPVTDDEGDCAPVEAPAPVASPSLVAISDDPTPLPQVEGLECGDLDSKYLVKKSSGQPKVLICHEQSGNPRSIVIACPAYRSHMDHHKDYLGTCR